MSKITILCVDDELEVLNAVVRDLGEIEDFFPIETAESAEEAEKLIQDLQSSDDHLGLIICDHVMPKKSGVIFLTELEAGEFTPKPRKILLTGQASHEETIDAINNAHIDAYLTKPWDPELLKERVREQLSHFVANTGINAMPYLAKLDPLILRDAILKRGLVTDA